MNLNTYYNLVSGDICNTLKTLAIEFPPDSIGWMYAKNSLLTKIFDHQMRIMAQNGVFEKRSRTKQLDCHEELVTVNIGFVAIPFYILIFGCASSIIVLIFEKLKIIHKILQICRDRNDSNSSGEARKNIRLN